MQTDRAIRAQMTMLHGTICELLDPEHSPVPSLYEVAWSLAANNRFLGHLRHDVDTLSHSLVLGHMVPAAHAIRALLHDASEAVLGDMIRPLKQLPGMDYYRHLEHFWQKRLYHELGGVLPYSADELDPPILSSYDAALCRYEAEAFGGTEFWVHVGGLTAGWHMLTHEEWENAGVLYRRFLGMRRLERVIHWCHVVQGLTMGVSPQS